jgi:hypothetical protein
MYISLTEHIRLKIEQLREEIVLESASRSFAGFIHAFWDDATGCQVVVRAFASLWCVRGDCWVLEVETDAFGPLTITFSKRPNIAWGGG